MRRIMLIDDNPIDLLVNERVVRNTCGEAEVVKMRSATEALESLCTENSCPDLLLLDIKMPLMDGFEFIKKLRNKRATMLPHTRILMVTSSIDPSDMARAENEEAIAGFLSKPLKEEELRPFLN